MTTITLPSLASLIDKLEEGVLFLDRNRRVVAINHSAADMLGHDQDQMLGKLCPNLFQGTECARACEQRGACSLMQQQDESKQVQNIVLKRLDGSLVALRMWATALPVNEPLAACAVVLTDCTREKELEHEASERMRVGGLIGHCPAMQDLFKQILRTAASEASVLITGESGTGKELVARALHENSSRAKGPYIRVNCAALAETILESELFGHARGAFTGAHTARAGRFEAADGGTFLLDEIGEISPRIQVKLLRVLQEREVERLGENQPRQVDVRIIAATNRNLAAMVKAGKFREDLYYRLRVIPLHVPPLRERSGDITLLANQLLGNLVQRKGGSDVIISQEALDRMQAYNWPGNVRELLNALEYALVQNDGSTIHSRHLYPEIQSSLVQGVETSKVISDAMPLTRYYHLPTQTQDEKSIIKQALLETGANKTAAARKLGMSRTTLWKRMKEYGL